MSNVIYTNFIDGSLSAGISPADGTATAAVFATLPAISGTDYAWLVIDPDAGAGAPEVVKITAHTASSTSVTISRGQQGSSARAHLAAVRVTNPVTKADLDSFVTGAEYLVDGSIATAKLADSAITTAKISDDDVTRAKIGAGAVGPTELGSDVFTYSAGDIKQSIRTVTETGWLPMTGGSYSNASSTYPDLWAVAPGSWKSGSTLTLPNMTDRIMQGPASGVAAGIGLTNGANTITLSTAHMPSHSHSVANHNHTMNHDHGAVNTDSDAHLHTMDHSHPAANTNATSHTHSTAETTINSGLNVVYQGGSGPLGLADGNVWGGVYGNPLNVGSLTGSATGGQHDHQFITPAHTGTSGSDTHDHSVDLPSFTGNTGTKTGLATGNTGSGSSFGIEQASLRVNYFIKT